MPNDKANMGTAMDALVGTLKQTKLNKQNFGPNDSVIASSVRHPGIAIDKAIEWLQQEMARVSGTPIGEQDEGSIYSMGEMNPEARANSALNMAGLAQVGAMPSAPISRGGTLGTVVNSGYDRPRVVPDATDVLTAQRAGMPIIGTGSATDVMVGSQAGTPFNGIPMGRNIPGNVPTQNINMRSNIRGQYKPEGIFNEVDPNKLAELMARSSKKKPTPDNNSITKSLDFSADGKVKNIKIGDSKIIYQVNDSNPTMVHISSVRTPVNKRGKGSARNAMNEFLNNIDSKGLSSKLESSPLDNKTNGNRLYDFYKSLGYSPTGKAINPAGDKELIRVMSKR